MQLSANHATRGSWSAVAGKANAVMETKVARVVFAAREKKSAKAKSSTKVTMAKPWLPTIVIARVVEVDATTCVVGVCLDTGGCMDAEPQSLVARRQLKSRIHTTRHVLRVIS